VLPEFRRRWPSPQLFLAANPDEVSALCKPLGFAQRRTTRLLQMTERFLAAPWDDPRQLPGIGEYAARAHEIFCQGKLGTAPPKDGSLGRYWCWASANVGVVGDKVTDGVELDIERRVGCCLHEGTHSEELTVSIEGAST
jgi:HhH-GPD superfamily base excision DNA repair protein